MDSSTYDAALPFELSSPNDSHTDYTSLLSDLQIAEEHHEFFISRVKIFRGAYGRSKYIKAGTKASYNTFSHRFLSFRGETFWGNDRQYLLPDKQGDGGLRYSKSNKKDEEGELLELLMPLWKAMREKMFMVMLPTQDVALSTGIASKPPEQTKDQTPAGDIDEKQSASLASIAQAALALLGEDPEPQASDAPTTTTNPAPSAPFEPQHIQIGQILTAYESFPLNTTQLSKVQADVNTFIEMKRQDPEYYAYIMYRIFFETKDGGIIEAEYDWIPDGDKWAKKYETMKKDDLRKWALAMHKLYQLFRA